MKTAAPSLKTGAFTLVELLVVIGIIGLLAALLLPALSKGELRAKRIVCENNLDQMGIVFNSFAHDHDGQFPMSVPMSEDGGREWVEAGYQARGPFYFSFRLFQVLSNELVTPQILICPSDLRLPATNFGRLQNGNLSYFIGVNASPAQPASILAGDRNLFTNSLENPTFLRLNSQSRVGWTLELHQYKGNVLFADGHVEEWGQTELDSAGNSSAGTADLFLPSVPPSPTAAGGASGGYSSGNPSSYPNPVNFPVYPDTGTANSGNAQPLARHAENQSQTTYGQTQGYENPSSSAKKEPAYSRTETKPAESLNLPTHAEAATDVTGPGSNGVPVAANGDFTMSPFDRRLVRMLHHLIGWSYFLLLLLVLLYVAYKAWQWSEERKQKQLARLRKIAAESALDSDERFR